MILVKLGLDVPAAEKFSPTVLKLVTCDALSGFDSNRHWRENSKAAAARSSFQLCRYQVINSEGIGQETRAPIKLVA